MIRIPRKWALEALLVGALFCFAFGLFDFDAFRARSLSLSMKLENWFFDTSGSSAGLVAAIAAWMAYTRVPLLTSSPPWSEGRRPVRVLAAGLLFIVCLSIFVWAELNDASDLLFIAVALLVASSSVYVAGFRGLRVMTLPIVVLFFALPIPYPLDNELLWTLQNWSASGTAHVLELLGVEIQRSGAHLQHGDVHFLVIEGCSGLRSILTLTLVSLVIRDLMGDRSIRGWIPVLIAPPLAVLLNTIRISMIVLGSSANDPGIGDDHLTQGLTVLAVGSVVLFFLGHFLALRVSQTDSVECHPERLPLRPLAAMLVVLAVAHLTIESWPPPSSSPENAMSATAAGLPFPSNRKHWNAEDVDLDYPFLGILPRGFIERRIYQRDRPIDRLGERSVDFLLAASSQRHPRGSPISSKLRVPGRNWQLEQSTREQNYSLGRKITVSTASSPEGRALVYSWTLHDEGFWEDTARSLFALERGPFARAKRRYMIQLATKIGSEPEARVHAKKILDRFVEDFREPFRAL